MRRRNRVRLVAAMTCLFALTACGDGRAVPAPVAVPSSLAPMPAPPTPLVAVTGSTAQITWTTPAGAPTAVSGYDVYVNRLPPLHVGPDVLTHSVAQLEPGSQHFVQVVARSGDAQSRPASVSFTVPYASPPRQVDGSAAPTANGQAADAPESSTGVAPAEPRRATATAPSIRAAQPPVAAKTHTLQGVLRIEESTSGTTTGKLPAPGECLHNQQDYDDIAVGTQVTVKGSDGTIVGVGELVSGALVDRRPPTHYEAEPEIPGIPGSGSPAMTVVGGICAYTIRVDNVRPSPFYSVLIGKRDPWQISATKLNEQEWTLALALGDGY